MEKRRGVRFDGRRGVRSDRERGVGWIEEDE